MSLFEVLRKCHLGTLSKICLRLRIKVDKWDYLNNPSQELKSSFCLGFLNRLEAKLERAHFLKVQSDRITLPVLTQ